MGMTGTSSSSGEALASEVWARSILFVLVPMFMLEPTAGVSPQPLPVHLHKCVHMCTRAWGGCCGRVHEIVPELHLRRPLRTGPRGAGDTADA